MKKYFLLNAAIFIMFFGFIGTSYAQSISHSDARYRADKTRIEEDCDFRSHGSSTRPSDLFVLTCWQNGVQILREACLSIPHFDRGSGVKNIISSTQFLNPFYMIPNDAACLIRPMDDNEHERD